MSLITISDIRAIRNFSGQIKEDDVSPYIEETEEIEICEFLGDELYYDLVNNSDNYTKLLSGTTYEYGNYDITFHGLKIAIAYIAFSRFLENHGINISKFGIVAKETENSEPVSEDTLSRFIGNARKNAAFYINETKKYLDYNSDDYPLWDYSGQYRPKVKSRIVKVNKI